jgi:hypothetical protein
VFNQAIVENRDLLAENQLGTVRMVQGAKEQALLNLDINKDIATDSSPYGLSKQPAAS